MLFLTIKDPNKALKMDESELRKKMTGTNVFGVFKLQDKNGGLKTDESELRKMIIDGEPLLSSISPSSITPSSSGKPYSPHTKDL